MVEKDSNSGDDFRVEVNPRLKKEAKEDKDCGVKNSTKEESIELDDDETDCLHVWGGPECDPKNDWVSDSDDSTKLRILQG